MSNIPIDETEMAKLLVRWRDRILQRAAINIEGHFFNKPTEDLTSYEQGIEKGIRLAVDEICKLMDDPTYFNRTPRKK